MRQRNASVVLPRSAAGMLLAILCTAATVAPALGQPSGETTVLRAARILDGRGAVLEDRDLSATFVSSTQPAGNGQGP